MTKEEYKELHKRGEYLFCGIITELNEAAELTGHGKDFCNTYRREQDFREICLALALAEKKYKMEKP